ncbi:hypothetical protein [Nitratiruptor sp. SB155-2]|uniref:hypothetical protein n=1 Tax=Nitratiruptor sp. (strain SB155-2) TaxID=387092 RepID=UPI000312B3E3|nr:hypothetical protein [Nitratiruptor sp. SB155-2]
MEINKKVLLLAIYKKEPQEALLDVIAMLENSHLFTRKEGKKLLKELKEEDLVNAAGLTVKGMVLARNIEEEFKL